MAQHRPTEGLLKPTEVAQQLKLDETTLARWRMLGTGPVFLRVGGRIRYPEADLRSWLESQRVEK
jgi:predicted site-specific integrase-resolvase